MDDCPFSSKVMALGTEWKLLQTGKHNAKRETVLEESKIKTGIDRES